MPQLLGWIYSAAAEAAESTAWGCRLGELMKIVFVFDRRLWSAAMPLCSQCAQEKQW